MASIEDKILGGPRENYCSSSEDEREDDTEEIGERNHKAASREEPPGGPEIGGGQPAPPPPGKWGGTSQNTGPKGVLRDWELYKQQEEFIRIQKERELVEMVKARALSTTTHAEDEKAKAAMEKLAMEMEEVDLDERLMSDAVLEEFVKRRMDLLIKQAGTNKTKFGVGLVHIQNGDEFLKIIDESDKGVSVLIHIFEDNSPDCAKMNECLESLSLSYQNVQWCKIRADAAGVSQRFRAKGIPALLVYKGGQLIGNFVQLTQEFGKEFYPGDVENFLIENGMIEDQNNIPALLAKQKSRAAKSGMES